MQARRGELVDALGSGSGDREPGAGDGLVAVRGAERVGLVTWSVTPTRDDAEIRSVVVVPDARGQGLGRSLIAAAHDRFRELGVRRAWLVTTNDNLSALRLYQRLGYRLAALRPGAVDEARRTIKHSIGEIGEHGIPIRDELELDLEL